MSYLVYIVVNMLFFSLFARLIFKSLMRAKIFNTQILNVYAFFSIYISILALEYGFYVTESEGYSHLNGAGFTFLLFALIFFKLLSYAVRSFDLISSANKKRLDWSYRQKKHTSIFILLTISSILIVLYLNILLSPSPIFSTGINRLNFWDHSRLPFLKSLLGERAMPIAIALGVLANYFNVVRSHFYFKFTQLLFVMYIIYLILLGHKFSPFVIAVFFYYLPFLVREEIKPSVIVRSLAIILPILTLYVLYEYTKIDSGIVKEYGGALGGALYRVFILQGHVFWNMFEQAGGSVMNEWSNLYWLIDNDMDGLVLTMRIISPNLVDGYLASGVRFTGAFPGFLLGTPMLFALNFLIFNIAVYGLILIRLINLIKCGSLFRLSLYSYLVYLYHFGITMGDFRFIASVSFFCAVGILVLTELIFITYRLERNRKLGLHSVAIKF